MSNEDTEHKVRENRLRRMAKRQGLEVRKSRARDPRAYNYGNYWLVDPNTSAIVAGHDTFGMDIDELQKALEED